MLQKEWVTAYRAVAARLNYLAQDRADIKLATMNVCSAMAQPTSRDWARLKRIGRYLLGQPRSICLYIWQTEEECQIYGFSDSDWAGDRKARKSISAGSLFRGRHCLKTWAKKQQVIALSSAEAELYAAVKTASESLGIQSLERT